MVAFDACNACQRSPGQMAPRLLTGNGFLGAGVGLQGPGGDVDHLGQRRRPRRVRRRTGRSSRPPRRGRAWRPNSINARAAISGGLSNGGELCGGGLLAGAGAFGHRAEIRTDAAVDRVYRPRRPRAVPPLAGRATCDRRMRVRSAEIQGPNHRPVTAGSSDGGNAKAPRERASRRHQDFAGRHQDGVKIAANAGEGCAC